MRSLTSSKETIIPKFIEQVLAIVAVLPFHKVNALSYLTIFIAASMTLVYPLRSFSGKLRSFCIRIRIRSAGLPTKDPIMAAVNEQIVLSISETEPFVCWYQLYRYL